MALYEDTLLCNFPKCRAKLSGFAWVTACSHIFCDPHGSGEFSRSPAVCPACSSALSGKLDIVRSELSPPEEYKAMVLAGLRPEIVLEISSRALAFWTYQVQQERLHQQYSLSRLEEQLKQTELLCSQRLQGKECEVSGVKGELSALSKLLEEYKRKYSDVSEKLMERNRQHHKLQGLYDSLRLRNMAASSQERERESRERERGSHNYIFSRAVGQPGFNIGVYEEKQPGFNIGVYEEKQPGFNIVVYGEKQPSIDIGVYGEKQPGFNIGVYGEKQPGFNIGVYEEKQSGFNIRVYEEKQPGFNIGVYGMRNSLALTLGSMRRNSLALTLGSMG
ncbi:E3 ubiquitin-protein ligase CCNB1IP1 [Acipenser ruthenus]|uniref:E3 ubiquitin-protein ligase CCNB1IP1 n=1 Tax=Acipenser ruthenus TaxID=7906 RepID=A0A444UN15_ACIRT|nr:E3 ubiquitin-protein ligase CCNB1IP1 [Acipenser ruthenus]